MSRRARFGRHIRVQQSLTGAIVAAAREMQNRQDSNIMDAWQRGGEYQGRKVTDEMVERYWKQRQSGLDKADPMYDTVQDQITQLQYGIAQSKQDLLHAQGKISDQKYAQFYLNWSKKVPKNSEFWRVLQKDAATLIEATKEKSRKSAETLKAEAFQKFQDSNYDKNSAVGELLTAAVDRIAEQEGRKLMGDGEYLLDALTKDIKNHPDEYTQLTDQIRKTHPGWNGIVDKKFFGNALDQAEQGYDEVYHRARKDGYVQAMNNAGTNKSRMSDYAQNTKAWDVAKVYKKNEAAFMSVWDDPMASENDKTAALQKFAGQIDSQRKTKGLDQGISDRLAVDYRRVTGQTDSGSGATDVGVSGFGGVAVNGQPLDDKFGAEAAMLIQKKALRDANPDQYKYGSIDPKTGGYDPTGKGPIGILPSGAVPPDAVAVVQPTKNGLVVAYVPEVPIFAQDPANPTGPLQQIATSATTIVGGVSVPVYSYTGPDGSTLWTAVDPRNKGVTESKDSNGRTVWSAAPEAVGADVLAAADAFDKEHNTTIGAQIRRGDKTATAQIDTYIQADGTKGKVKTGTVELKFENGQLLQTESGAQTRPGANGTTQVVTGSGTAQVVTGEVGQASSVLDPSRVIKGKDVPNTGASPEAASLSMLTHHGLTADDMRKIVADPEFQYNFVRDEMKYYGTNDPGDPRITPDLNVAMAPALAAEHRKFQAALDPQHAALRGEFGGKGGLDYPGLGKADAQGQKSITFGTGSSVITLPGNPLAPQPMGYAGERNRDPSAVQYQYGPNAPYGTTISGIAPPLPGQPGYVAPAGPGAPNYNQLAPAQPFSVSGAPVTPTVTPTPVGGSPGSPVPGAGTAPPPTSPNSNPTAPGNRPRPS